MSDLIRPAPMREFDVGERKATWLELFFDLCFVAAVAALAEGLHSDPTLRGLWHFAALFVPVWWAWMEFTWFATAWDNDDVLHRVGMLVAMLLVIVLAAGIPRVYEGNDRVFVVAYAAMQGLLVLMFARVLPHAGTARRFARNYAIGDATGGLIMLSSLLVEPPARYWVWALSVLVLMVAPVFAVRAYEGQPFDSRHVPERYGLFTIIVLGESVIVVAASLGDVALDGGSIASALLGFAIAATIWWGYFETVSSTSLSRERVGASFLWGYGHLFGFAGIAATAIGVELAVEAGAAGDHGLSLATRLMLGGGIAAFLVSLVAIHTAEIGWRGAGMLQRWIAIAALLAVAVAGRGWPPALMVGAVFGVLVVSVALDIARHGGKGLAAEHLPDNEQVPPSP
ncbi:MAG: low temperature requirement protein A [Actinomycetota bacterium]